MAWNEPGGGKDPWGGKRGNDGPPDLDEALNQLKKKFSSFGGGSNGSGGPDGKSLLPGSSHSTAGTLGTHGLLPGR